MASKRKPISKTLRFEVFKRDSFTCQYCGQKAPDVKLEVDHISPVSKGGENDILNLVTSCFDCNRGKGARELTEGQELEKQRAQLEDLNERRNQLELMVEWKAGLALIEDDQAQKISDLFIERTGSGFTDTGISDCKKWVRRFGFSEVLESAYISLDQYTEGDDESSDDIDKAFNYIPRICGSRQRDQQHPGLKKLYYTRGILRNRLHYMNEKTCLDLLIDAHDCGVDPDDLMDIARSSNSWAQFRDAVEGIIHA